ncbi:rod shape-determining protein MreC [Alkalibacillus haloalkaliphilus]|uniref:Cell shape-determining protein MreC n=1 Tax=Alkalibacillus haloalkaliphilus TaxID=94136 RepID=A0A511W4C7_9BACI|nr:rod shape-determining protein MreC [Alkalibacillus haloalkaliphilus]MDV2581123.1 rod shape-determining protein MreC [Alkalibacillus haloalkaliphilus]GEN45807.1 cell shape-determining protein MreC [Alkalibacillus haloalkaliphilus]
MPSFLRKRKLIVFLVGIILVVSLIGYSLRSDSGESLPAQFAIDTVGFFQNILHTPLNYFVEIFDSVGDIKSVYEQNQVLKEELQDYKTLAYQVSELETENEELRAMAEVDSTLTDYETLNAAVVARSPERWFQQVTINRGKQHGVEANMAVRTAEGMVGKVINASQLTSTVQLLSGFGTEHQVSAIVDGDDSIFGLVEGYDSDTEKLVFRELTGEDELEEGQAVVTSGLGGVFPRGILIGEVSSIELDSYGLTKVAYVEPAANLQDISQVMVVDRDLHSTVIDEEEEEE